MPPGYSQRRKCRAAVGLCLAEERIARSRDRVERGFHVGEVDQGGATARKDEGKSVGTHQAVVRGLGTGARGQLVATRLLRLLDPLDHHHLRAVDGTVGMLAAGEAGLPGQRRVSGRVDEARRRKDHVAVTGRELERAYPAAVARHSRSTAPSSTVMAAREPPPRSSATAPPRHTSPRSCSRARRAGSAVHSRHRARAGCHRQSRA